MEKSVPFTKSESLMYVLPKVGLILSFIKVYLFIKAVCEIQLASLILRKYIASSWVFHYGKTPEI